MDSGIKFFWPNYKVGAHQNFKPGNRLGNSNPDFNPIRLLNAKLKCSQNPAGIVEEFAVLDFVAWPERWNMYEKWLRQVLTLTEVLNGSVICKGKTKAILSSPAKISSQNVQVCRAEACRETFWRGIKANSCIHISVTYAGRVCGLQQKEKSKSTLVCVICLALTRGSFCRSVWGTAPGRAATSMGLDAWHRRRERKGKRCTVTKQIKDKTSRHILSATVWTKFTSSSNIYSLLFPHRYAEKHDSETKSHLLLLESTTF